MNFKWENAFSKTLTSCVAIMGLASTLHAGPEMKSDKTKQPAFAFAYPKDMHLNNPRDFYFYVEGLALQGMESNLDFTIVNSTAAPVTTLNGKMGGFGQDESWDYNFGLRAGWGIYMNHDAWTFDLSWMWVNVTNSQSYQAGTGATLPIWLPHDGAIFTSRGSSGANWGADMNVLDAALGKPYYISRKVIFNPHFGLRFAWIGQDYNVNYGGSTPATAVKFKADNDFFGVGGRVGVNTDWILGAGFKFYSNISSSILAGWFDNSERFTVAGTAVNANLKNKPQMVVPNMDIALGLDWGTDLGNCGYYFDMRAGYEFQIWWNQWNMRQFVSGGTTGNFVNVPVQGDLTLNGFTFKIQLDM